MNALRNALLALATAGFAIQAEAELAEVTVVNTGGTEIVPGYVFQGSRKMKKLGKNPTASSIVVPRLFPESDIAPLPVIPQLATVELKPKPRFGYGSDWTPGKSYQPKVAPVSSPSNPLYYFRAPYSTREYYPSHYFGYDFGCRPFTRFGRHFSFSIFR